jgi:hypothetical protein
MMEYLVAQYATGMVCQLMQAGHIIAGFLYVIAMAIVVVLGSLCDLVTWFTLQLYHYYIPWLGNAWHFFMAGLHGYPC